MPSALTITPYSAAFLQMWDDGSLFTGFLLTAIVPPTYSGVSVPTVGYNNIPSASCPAFLNAPITDGVFSTACGLLPSALLQPPNSRYVSWLYDNTGTRVAGPSAFYTVSASEVTPPTFTPIRPVAGVTIPVPN